MARKGDHHNHISKIGAEGFGLLEEFFPSRYPVPQGLLQFPPPQGHHSRPEEAVLNNFQAAQKYGGMVFVDNNRTRKPGQVRK